MLRGGGGGCGGGGGGAGAVVTNVAPRTTDQWVPGSRPDRVAVR